MSDRPLFIDEILRHKDEQIFHLTAALEQKNKALLKAYSYIEARGEFERVDDLLDLIYAAIGNAV